MMRILYAIQGTGNGHLSRAREIIPYLKKYGDLDLLISGTEAEVKPDQEVKYQYKGIGFVFGKKGGIDFAETWKRIDSAQFIKNLRSLPVNDYDLILNDFEPVTAWACKLRGKKSVALSHQSAFLSPKTPKVKGFHWGRIILNNYAPAQHHVSFHFQKYDNFINTPIIRTEIRNLKPENHRYYTVYLPAYADEFILGHIKNFPHIRWQIFSKHSAHYYERENAAVFPVDNTLFQKSLENCEGLLTGSGFEGPAEALYLGKKILAVPMNHQYEQQCNALALEKMGIPVIWKEKEFGNKLRHWIESDGRIPVDFPDETAYIIENIIKKHAI